MEGFKGVDGAVDPPPYIGVSQQRLFEIDILQEVESDQIRHVGGGEAELKVTRPN